MARILTVDDSSSMRQMVRFALQEGGFEVVEAADGEEALSFAKSQQVDLVITDINMPRMDGISLVKALRQLQTYRFTPILLLTTESAPEKKSEGKAAGASGWIVKPFSPDTLLKTVGQVIRR